MENEVVQSGEILSSVRRRCSFSRFLNASLPFVFSQLTLYDHLSFIAVYLTHRPPSPPSLLVLLFTLSHKLAPSDLLFLASLPPSIPLLPVFTKTDLCPIHDIAEKKKSLENAIQAARQSAFLEAEEREKRRRLARLSEEFDSGKDASAGLGPGGAEKEVVKGKTWEGMCVSTKKGWVLRDKVRFPLRSSCA